MTCPDCQAATERHHYGYRASCKGCQARAVARGPDFHRCRAEGKQDREYRELLKRVGVTHDEVLQARKVDQLAQHGSVGV